MRLVKEVFEVLNDPYSYLVCKYIIDTRFARTSHSRRDTFPRERVLRLLTLLGPFGPNVKYQLLLYQGGEYLRVLNIVIKIAKKK